jgi:nucleoside triphosphate pyrophosphatase
MKLYLASASPRRKALLEQLSLSFDVCPVDADEAILAEEKGACYVERLAKLKANMALANLRSDGNIGTGYSYVVGSDTSVVIEDIILGKPLDQTDFTAMMLRLSGASHEVLTGICVARYDAKTEDIVERSQVVSTAVKFKRLSSAEIEAYWNSGEPADKAGGYGIQGLGAVLVDTINGSYSNVVGLPVSELKDLLVELGFDFWGSLAIGDRSK